MSHNDITGDKIQTKVPTEAYRNNYDDIFGKQLYDKCKYQGSKPWEELYEPVKDYYNEVARKREESTCIKHAQCASKQNE